MKTVQFSANVLEIADCDVCVVGGGSSGIAAAVGAARSGASTLLVERYGFLGGTATASMVGPFMTSYSSDGSQPITGGVFQQIVDRMVALGGAIDPGQIDHSTAFTSYISLGHARVTPFHPEALKLAAVDITLDAGVRLMLHTGFVQPLHDGSQLTGVLVHNKAGLGVISAKVIVDCSADADVAAAAGVPCTKGRSSDGKMMPATMFMRFGNIDDAEVEAYVRAHPEESRIFADVVAKAHDEGRWNIPRKALNIYREPSPGEWRANISRLHDVDGTKPQDLTQAEIDGRRQCMTIFNFMKANCPGFEDARLLETAAQIGIRETRHIQGHYVMTAEDVLTGARFDDAIARCAYPIDIHSPTDATGHLVGLGNKADASQQEVAASAPPFYDIPYRSLVPLEVGNLLVAGRPISATHEAAASLRVMPPCFATGHAAGCAAALATEADSQVAHVDAGELRRRLHAQGAIC